MSLRVRLATPADLPALAGLLHEMEIHYEGAAALAEGVARLALERHVFGAAAGIEILLAEADGRAVGLAFLSPLFPAQDLTPALFLKDIFVSESARLRGVGTALLRATARRALARGCHRVNWNAARDNAAAMAFYAKVGARLWDEVACLRLDGDALARLAAADDGGVG